MSALLSWLFIFQLLLVSELSAFTTSNNPELPWPEAAEPFEALYSDLACNQASLPNPNTDDSLRKRSTPN